MQVTFQSIDCEPVLEPGERSELTQFRDRAGQRWKANAGPCFPAKGATNERTNSALVAAFAWISTYVLVVASAIWLRRKDKQTPRPFRKPLFPFLPAVGLIGMVLV